MKKILLSFLLTLSLVVGANASDNTKVSLGETITIASLDIDQTLAAGKNNLILRSVDQQCYKACFDACQEKHNGTMKNSCHYSCKSDCKN